jgi:photosystem II stability/assembly factor-like uncharacterized protein
MSYEVSNMRLFSFNDLQYFNIQYSLFNIRYSKPPIYQFHFLTSKKNNFIMRTKLLFALSLVLFTTLSVSAQWVKQNTPTMNGLFHMHAVNKNTMWTPNVNLGGLDTTHTPQFIRTGDGGKTYKLGQLDKDYLYGFGFIEPFDAKTAYLMAGSASTPNYYFRRTTDSGATWQDMPYHPTTYPGLIHFYDANNGVYVGDPDSLGFFAAFTTNGGNTFSRIPQVNLPRPDADEFTNLGNFQVLGDNLFLETYQFDPQSFYLNKRIMRSTDRGRNWTLGAWVNTGDIFETRFRFTDANNGMILRGIGTLDMKSPLYTTDGGATWKESGNYPGLVSYPIDNIPNSQTMVAIFQDPKRGITFTAATNDLGKTWNSQKEIGASILDKRYADILGLDYYINGQLEIVDNNTAWAQFSNTAIHRYDSSTPLVPEKPDLDLELKADNDGLPLYGSVKYTLTVKNRGISPATGVKINWLPPYKRTNNGAGAYAYQGAYADKGYYDSWNGVWSLDNIEAGASATATFHLFVVKNNENITQTAQVMACNETDLDSAPNNMSGAAKEDDEVGFMAKASTDLLALPNDGFKAKTPEFMVSPNPAKDKINVFINADADNFWSIRVLNNVGQVVYTKNGQSNGLVDIDAKNLVNGLYLVEYEALGERKIEKIMVQH